MLEVASVAGVEFVAAAVAAGLEADAAAVEEHCEALVEQQLLHPLGVTTWPNGTVATRYAFVHALYQQVVYERLGAGRRVRLHQRLGECLETAYGAQAGEIAAELAEHFVRGQDTQRAVHYLHQAAENALHRCAQVEAINHLTRGLELLTTLPETPERLQHELDLQVLLGAAWAQARGWSAPEVGQAYARARVLCQRLGAPPQLPVVLLGQFMWCVPRAEWQTAHELGEHLHTLAQRQADPVLLLSAHTMLGVSLSFVGRWPPHTHTSRRGARCMSRPLTVPPWRIMVLTWECSRAAMRRCPCGCSAHRCRPWRRCTRRVPWRRSWRTPIVWPLPSPCDVPASVAARHPGNADRGRGRAGPLR